MVAKVSLSFTQISLVVWSFLLLLSNVLFCSCPGRPLNRLLLQVAKGDGMGKVSGWCQGWGDRWNVQLTPFLYSLTAKQH